MYRRQVIYLIIYLLALFHGAPVKAHFFQTVTKHLVKLDAFFLKDQISSSRFGPRLWNELNRDSFLRTVSKTNTLFR